MKDQRVIVMPAPQLIKNFVDKDAEFIYVQADKVKEQAKALDAIPFEIPGH